MSIKQAMDTNMQEDEAPPLLVDAEGEAPPSELETAMDDISLTKVPITIVTGKPRRTNSSDAKG